jgi:hypothetical protein
MKILDDCMKQTICSAFYHLQWSAASAFFVAHRPSIAPCDMLRSLVCKPNFDCGEVSDHNVAQQRFRLSEFFIYQLMRKRVALKRILKFILIQL